MFVYLMWEGHHNSLSFLVVRKYLTKPFTVNCTREKDSRRIICLALLTKGIHNHRVGQVFPILVREFGPKLLGGSSAEAFDKSL